MNSERIKNVQKVGSTVHILYENVFVTTRDVGKEIMVCEFEDSDSKEEIRVKILWKIKSPGLYSWVSVIRENVFWGGTEKYGKLYVQKDSIVKTGIADSETIDYKSIDIVFPSLPDIILSDGIVVFNAADIRRIDEKGNSQIVESKIE